MNMDNIMRRQQFENMIIKSRAEKIKAMNTLLEDDEDKLELWYWVYPDGATEEDILDMAEDEEVYEELVDTFLKAVNNYRL